MEAAARNETRYTYADLESWDDDTRYELIDGVVYAMAPPSTNHGHIGIELVGQLWVFLKGKPCKVFHESLGVRLNADEDDDTFFIPDIAVVCDKSKLDDKGCNGAPDLVIEILSPSTASRDWNIKKRKYLEAGVREYWIVDPAIKKVYIHLTDGNPPKEYGETEAAPVGVLEGCSIDLSAVFGAI